MNRKDYEIIIQKMNDTLEEHKNAVSEDRLHINRRYYELAEKKVKAFPTLFRNHELRDIATLLIQHGYYTSVDGKEPQELDEMYGDLLELDEKVSSGELEYVHRTVTDDDYICIQAWFATPELCEEYIGEWERQQEINSNRSYFIPNELYVLAPFLEKYNGDSRLIEIWSGMY